MKSLVFVILGKWNYGFNVLYCYQFARHTNSSLPKYISNFPYFTGFPACALAKRYVFSLIFALMR